MQLELPIAINQDFPIQAEIPLNLPFDDELSIEIDQPIPIDIEVPISLPIEIEVMVPVEFTVPIALDVPVVMDIPIDIVLNDTPFATYLSNLSQKLRQEVTRF